MLCCMQAIARRKTLLFVEISLASFIILVILQLRFTGFITEDFSSRFPVVLSIGQTEIR